MSMRGIAVLVALAACHRHGGGGSDKAEHMKPAARVGAPGVGGDQQCSGSAASAPAPAPAPPVIGSFKPTAQHPHLFWTPDRLARAQQWAKDTKFVSKHDKDEVIPNAFAYVVTKDTEAGKLAVGFIQKVMTEKLIEKDDQTRWNGEMGILVYDWCFDLIPEADRAAFLDYANHWFDHWNHEAWGGPGHEEGNYFWGYLRNGLEWALASSTENPKAQAFLDDALVTRWEKLFLPFAQTVQKGGLPSEGTQYGRYQESYPLLPFLTLASGGRNIFDETDWYRGATYYNIYNTPLAISMHGDQQSFEMFPDNDDEYWIKGNSSSIAAYGDFMTAMATTWPDKPVGQHARHWLKQWKPPRSVEIEATDPGGTDTDYTKLPLDYYAPGAGFLWMHGRWAPDSTEVFAQWGFANSIGGHQHLDAGTFQIWRKGRWLSRESAEYYDNLVDYDGVAKQGRESSNHNAILFGGKGTSNAYQDGMPVISRVESRKDYAYIETDLSEVYRAREGHADRDDNPFVAKSIRELVFLRELETTVILDRMESSSDSQHRKGWTGAKLDAADVPKTFVLHFEQPAKPKLETPSTVLSVNGDQALRVITLVPKAPTYRIVDERPKPEDKVGQQRLEIETKGSAQSYFINVLQARDASAPDVTATVTEDAKSFTVSIVHPSGHKATIVFDKGMASTGGTITTDGCTVHALADYVQQITVTDSGPAWGP
jgi:hypothetical protein